MGESCSDQRTYGRAASGACQAAILYQFFLSIDSGYPALAFGRFDQYTWPYLKADLESGRLTLDQAQEIVDAFFLKANCFYGGAPGKLAQTTGIGNTYQHTTIGGIDPDTGEDATNTVTYMVLESIGRLKLHDPPFLCASSKHPGTELWEGGGWVVAGELARLKPQRWSADFAVSERRVIVRSDERA